MPSWWRHSRWVARQARPFERREVDGPNTQLSRPLSYRYTALVGFAPSNNKNSHSSKAHSGPRHTSGICRTRLVRLRNEPAPCGGNCAEFSLHLLLITMILQKIIEGGGLGQHKRTYCCRHHKCLFYYIHEKPRIYFVYAFFLAGVRHIKETN